MKSQVGAVVLAISITFIAASCHRSTPAPAPKQAAAPIASTAPQSVKSNDSRMIILEDAIRDCDVVWNGSIDNDAIKASLADLYEQMRARANAILAAKPPQVEDKIFISLWVSRADPKYGRQGTAYMTVNSSKLAHQIPPWSAAEVKIVFPRDLDTRPSLADEQMYAKFMDESNRLVSDLTPNPGEGMDAFNRRCQEAGAAFRKQFCEQNNLTIAQLDQIEAHNTLWSIGQKATPAAIDDYLKPIDDE